MSREFAVTLRCPCCRWYTARAQRPDNDYGKCPKCSTVLVVPQRRRLLRGGH